MFEDHIEEQFRNYGDAVRYYAANPECLINYLKQYPHLFFPGKDDRSKDDRKVRARVSFGILEEIDRWRVKEMQVR